MKTFKRLVGGMLILAMAFGFATSIPKMEVFACSIKTVNYYNNGEFYKRVTDEDGTNETVVYCIQPDRAYDAGAGTDGNKRVKYVWNAAVDDNYPQGSKIWAHVLAWSLSMNGNGSYGKYQYTPNDVADSAECADLIAAILYNGYPNTNDYTEKETQYAVFWAVINGKPDGRNDANNTTKNTYYKNSNGLVAKALTNAPSSYNLYVYTSTANARSTADGMTQQFLVSATFPDKPEQPQEDPTTKGELKTTVTANVNGKDVSGGTEAAKVVLPQEGMAVTVTDKIDYSGLKAGATYTVQGTLMEVAEDGTCTQVAQSEAKELKAEAESGTWTIEFGEVTLEVGKKYVVFEKAVNKEDTTEVIEHNNPKDPAQTMVVSLEEPENPGDTPKGDDDNPGDNPKTEEPTDPGNTTPQGGDDTPEVNRHNSASAVRTGDEGFLGLAGLIMAAACLAMMAARKRDVQ